MTKPCPVCGALGTLGVELRMVGKEPGSYSLSGNQLKVTCRARAVLVCAECDFALYGRLDPEDSPAPTHFIADRYQPV